MSSPYPSLRWWLLPFIRSRIWTVRGLDHLPTAGGFVLVANHQSWLDSAILAAAVYSRIQKPLKFVAQTAKYGALGGLAIDQRDRANVIDRTLEWLNRGYPIVIFPEGNSNKAPELRTGKTGAARLALRSGLPVVPVGIKGTRGTAPWRAVIWFFSLLYPCHVEIGQPITFPKTELGPEDSAVLRATTDDILRRISELSGKPMPGQGPALGRRGVFWFFTWRLFRPLIQWRVRIRGAEHVPVSGPFIVVGNHASYFDAPAMGLAIFHVTGLQPMFPTKASVGAAFQKMVGRGGLDALGMLPLNNENKGQVLLPAIDHLRHGGVIGIFPEGTRNKPALNSRWQTELLKGKTGAARLLIASGAPVIPMAIKAPPGLGILESILKGIAPWNFLRVTIGPPIVFTNVPASLEQATKDDLDRLTRHVMTAVAGLAGMTYPH